MKQQKHKLNRVDILVIALVVALIAGTCVKFLVLDPKQATAEQVRLEYQVKITGLRKYSVDALALGDQVFTETGKAPAGTIAAIDVRDNLGLSGYPDGTVRETPIEDRYDVYLTLETQAAKGADGSYKAGTYEIKRNASTGYITKYQGFSGTILTVSEVSP